MTDSSGEGPGTTRLAEYVLGSEVRKHLLESLRTGSRSTAGLLDAAAFSDSAVYGALGDLEERGLISGGSERDWRLTGLGRTLADFVDVAVRLETVVESDEAYWQEHDLSVVPERFRREIYRLGDCEVVRSSPTNPTRVQDRVAELIRSADSIDVMTEVRHGQYARYVEERAASASARLIFGAGLLESEEAGRYRDPEEWSDDVSLWAHDDVRFTMAVLGDRLVLSLPTLDGKYDMYSEVVADGEALEWGEELFEHYLATATPLAEYVAGE